MILARQHLVRLGPAVSALLFAIVSGCASPPAQHSALASALPVGHPFGDTAMVNAKAIAFDSARGELVVELSRPSHLMVLEVRLGQTLAVLHPAPRANTTARTAGQHRIRLGSGVAVNTRPPVDAEMERCVERELSAAESRRSKQRPAEQNDSKGKPTAGSKAAQAEFNRPTFGDEQAARQRCATASASRPARSTEAPKGTRYFLLLAATGKMSGAELSRRIAGLSGVGSDVASSIDAIATGVFVGYPTDWSGYYVRR